MAAEHSTSGGSGKGRDIETPILSDESEEFFKRLASEDGPFIPLPRDPLEQSGDHTRDLGGADQVPLPMSPPAEAKATPDKNQKGKHKAQNYFSYIQSKIGPLPFTKEYKKKQAASNLHDVATAVRSGESLDVPSDPKAPKHQVDQEKADLSHVLDKLNLSAVNNKAFSFSEKSNELMQEFVQVLKDLINGVPTAYNDLENLLTRSDKDLREMYDKMPPFLQKLIKSLPTKVSATVLPGLMAAASEKPGADGKHLNVSAAPKPKSRKTIPSLKSLVQGDVVVTMLRSILNFLKLRFPALLSGTNILVSLAVFLLLLVFWYCYKRGKEVRLEKERRAAEGQSDVSSVSEFDDSAASDDEAPPKPKDTGPKK